MLNLIRCRVSCCVWWAVLAAVWPVLALAQDHEATLEAVQRDARAAAPVCIQATVGIIVRDADGDGTGNGRSMGSGVVVSGGGLILSAAHVVLTPGAELIIVLADGTRVRGETLGVDHDVDAGMARITDAGRYAFVPVGEADSFSPGDWCLAAGHPGGIQTDRHPPLRLGRILHRYRAGDGDGDGEEVYGNVVSDCTVISGDSGGPLFDRGGRVIAIHSNIGRSANENRHVAVGVYHRRWDALLAGEDLSSRPHRGPIDPPGPEDFEVRLDEDGNRIDPADTDGDGEISEDEAARNVLRMNLGQQYAHLLTRAEIELIVSVAEFGPRGRMWLDIPPAQAAAVQAVMEKIQGAQTPSGRMPGPVPRSARRHGRSGPAVRRLLAPVAAASAGGVVVVEAGGEAAALGTVVGGGLVLTKASEIDGEAVAVRLGDAAHPARLVGVDDATDLALLRVGGVADGLVPVRWRDVGGAAPLGTVLICPNAQGEAIAVGVVSVQARPVPEKIQSIGNGNRAFLGVAGLGGGGSAVIQQVIEGGGAEAAGMLDGDAIVRVQDIPIRSHADLVEAIGQFEPGTTVEVEVLRGDAAVLLYPTLQDATGKFAVDADDRLPTAQLSRQAGAISRRRTGFPRALTYDGVVWAGDCGGPLLGLDARAVGIHIARYGRTASYVLPADEVRRVIAALLAAEGDQSP